MRTFALKHALKAALVLAVLLGIAALGWALYGRGGDAREGQQVEAAFYKEEPGATHRLENEHLLFEMDADSTQFTLTNKADGQVWRSIPEGADQDPQALAGMKNLLQSTLALTYSTTNGVRTLYDSYEYAIKNQVYEIVADGDHIRVDYTLGRIARAYFIPSVIAVGKMDGFLDQLTKAQKRKVLDSYRKHDPERIKENQREALLAQYPQLEDGAIYVIRDNVRDFLKEEFEDLLAQVGYTYQDYLEDQAEAGGVMGSQSAVFNLSLVYRLENQDLLVEVPLDAIRYTDDFPPVRLNILPNFGAGGPMDSGYMLVPEGGGGLIRFNNGKIRQNGYFANIYGWDHATTRTAVVHETRARFPVFGIASGDSAFLCLMEGQAANASITAEVAGRGNSYNTASASYNLLHSDAFNVTDRTIETIYMYEKGLPSGAISQRYRFLPTADPVELALAYRAYLQERYPGLGSRQATGLPVAVEIVGAIDKVQQRGGLPVSAPVKLTSFEEAAAIVADLSQATQQPLQVRLSGFLNGGLRQKMLGRARLVRQLGSPQQFDDMARAMQDSGARVYLHGITAYALDSGLGDGFLPLRDAARLTTREHVKLYPYSNVWYGQMSLRDPYYLLRPDTARRMMAVLAQAALDYRLDGVSYEDLGNLLASDFDPRQTVTRDEALTGQVQEQLRVADLGLRSAVRGGNLYALEHASLVSDMDLEGVPYFVLDETLPFFQIALHGLVDYTGRPLNLTGDWEQELLLSAQRGAGLFFVFMQEEPLVLHDTDYARYYGASYSLWAEQAGQIIRDYTRALGGVFGQPITGFARLTDQVTLTTFADGQQVAVNFGHSAGRVQGHNVPARSYLVIDGEVTP